MRIEQYFLMTDYALWEVIVNGDSPPLKRTVDGVEQTISYNAEENVSKEKEWKKQRSKLWWLKDSLGYDWSDLAKDEEHYKTFAIMACTSSAAVSVNTARPINPAFLRPIVNSARTASNIFNRAHTHASMPFNKSTTNKNSNLKEKVNTVKGNVTTARPKAVVSDNKGNEANAVKASACREDPKTSLTLRYEEINGGFVAFGGDPKGGRITGKGKISTDTECIVLSPDFKLLDENHVLLRVPRKDNMYIVDLNNIIPLGGLTCLFAKTTLDDSNSLDKRA
ncbi:hypothetical protein Tco_0290167 [Tanacetum coccineum]